MNKQYTSDYMSNRANDISARIMRILQRSAEKEEDAIVGLNIAFIGLSKACYRMCDIVGNHSGGTREAIEMLMRSIANMDNYVRQKKEEESGAWATDGLR